MPFTAAQQRVGAGGGYGVAQRNGEDAGGKEIQNGFDIEDGGVAGHAFVHGAEHTGAAGAEQDDDGNVFVEEFFLADAFFGRKDFVDQPACATGGFADAFFQVAQFTNHEAEHSGQHHGGIVFHAGDAHYAQADGSQAE